MRATPPHSRRISVSAVGTKAVAAAGVVWLFVSVAAANDGAASVKMPKLSKKWLNLHGPKKGAPKIGPLPSNSPLQVVSDLELIGPYPGDPFKFGNYKSEGEWAIIDGALKPVSGKHTACRLAKARDFELKGVLNAEGLGGWFFLVGWNAGDGYMIYNVTLRASGSPWMVVEFDNGRGLEPTHSEIHRYEWKGDQPFSLAVEANELNLTAGNEVIARDIPLPNYQPGEVIVGTYDTRYGPKPLSIRSMRIRAK